MRPQQVHRMLLVPVTQNQLRAGREATSKQQTQPPGEEMEEVMVERTAGGAADLLMECDEEELDVYPQSPERDEEEEEEEEGLEAGDETDPPPVRIIPIPVQPVSSCSLKHNSTLQCSGPLGFRLNGRPISLLPEGAGVELKLRSHPEGSSSGFTSVQIPVTLTVHSPAGTQHINTTASLTTAAAPAAVIPKTEPTPIITGVVSGEAAQRVLSNHSVNFKFSPPVTGLKTPPSTSPVTLTSPRTTASAPRGGSKRRAPPPKLLHKGQLGPVSPPDCLVCRSQYKLIMELRGFMCLCSPEIAQSLKNLKKKKKKKHRRSKTSKSPKEPQSASKVSKSRPSAAKVTSPIQRTHRPSGDFVPVRFTSPVPPPVTACSPQVQNQSEPPSDQLRGKLVIMVEDFYYGSARGQSSITDSRTERKPAGPYRCIHCPHTLHNNIKLMSHMNQHVSTMSEQDGLADSASSCPHCFRPFTSPFKLQCHLEAVHSQYKSTAKCKICELEFGSEPSFLWHMKSAHKPGEMPYVCQVCDFRSSFYSDLWTHFEQLHADTKHLLCQYCLRVLRSNTCYQQHFARHQKKNVFSCDKCRLHFLYIRERTEHNLLHHRTHVRPPQLTGLKPGTKVTVRTYSVVQGSENEEVPKKRAALKVVDVDLPPPKQEAPRRKPVESLGPLLSNLNQQSEDTGVSRPSQHCLECLTSFQDFRTHFPSLVHCSLCKFVTCCSTSYANHMINNHATCRKKPQYHSIFLSEPRLSHKLKCVSCTFTTCKGDVMANHLTERPDHHCIMLTHNESSMDGEKTMNTQPADISSSVTSPSSQGSGIFIPIHLLPSGQTSSQLSVKALTSPSPLSSPPAMTIKFLGPRPQPDQCSVSPLSASQLSAVLSYLCHGLLQATRRSQASPQTIHSWIRQQEHHLSYRKWCWRTETLAEWVMSQREQQLSVSEDVLLQTARKALGENSYLTDCYSWAVDFLLRHELAVQPSQNHRGRLPRSIRDNSRVFIQLLSAQVQGKNVPPNFVASMDEFSIFIDQDQFSDQNPSALRLFGSPEEKPVFDVILSALSDGTLLPPLLFYRGTPSLLPEGFPGNVLLEARQEEFTDQDCHKIWINKVWKPHVASHWQSVLIVDVHRGHLRDEFRTSLTSLSTDVFFIPSGCCCRLQPLDVCVTPVLRDFLQARWTQLVSQGGLDGLGLDQLALTLACWLSEVSSTLNSETNVLRRSFASACNLQEVEDRGEVVRIIQALTEALVQPLETSEPAPDPEPEPELELLLVMEEEKKQQEEPTALHQVFDGDRDQESFVGF
ncbi:pogo transposable element with ZNF domain isoform X1 [Pagrus major]|uniref:pogo transposable element with ZNF domain isoform X1 n=1 Tax=Pagrus major TaxID=143350 RepID=UPI003CC86DA6